MEYNVSPVPNVKYLGININGKLNFNLHSATIKKKTIARPKMFKTKAVIRNR